MSVPSSLRNLSKVQFVYTAKELKLYTIRKCKSFIKSYTYYTNIPCVENVNEIFNCVIKANNIYPRNQHEAQIRRDYLVEARGRLYILVTQVDDMYNLFQFRTKKDEEREKRGERPQNKKSPEDILEEWMGLIDKEFKLIQGVLDSDLSRSKKLP
jgi:hypothetical protein